MIDAKELREAAVGDIRGSYLHADVDEKNIVRFDGTIAEILVNIDPKIFKPYVQVELNGQLALYVELQKLYGCLRSRLLF